MSRLWSLDTYFENHLVKEGKSLPILSSGGKGEGGGGGGGGGQVVHPRQCICDQCMAEYGTFKFYNQILQASPVVDQNEAPLQG